MAATVNVAELWPARIFTVGETVASEVSSLINVTIKSEVGASDTVTVPTAALLPAFSANVDGLIATVNSGVTDNSRRSSSGSHERSRPRCPRQATSVRSLAER